LFSLKNGCHLFYMTRKKVHHAFYGVILTAIQTKRRIMGTLQNEKNPEGDS